MGRKGNWFSNVKKALSPDSKREENSSRSKKKWFGKQKQLCLDPSTAEEGHIAAMLPPLPPQEEDKTTDFETENRSHLGGPTAAPPEPHAAAVPPPPAAPEVVVVQTTTKVARFIGKSGEEAATIKIQTAFRGYLARRALRALRGLVRLKLLMEGSVVKRQAANTLKCMQTLARVQTQIRSRRIRMLEENQALQRQLLQKHAKDLDNLRVGEDWDDSLQSKEQIEASLLNKYEASVRRERALAYAFTHQQTLKNPPRSANPMFMDPRNPSWGWSWLERWMAARPWESRAGGGPTEKDNDSSSVKSRSVSAGGGGEINKSYARYLLNSEAVPTTPTRPIPSKKVKSASPRVGRAPQPPPRADDSNDDARSAISSRRHSTGGGGPPSLRDDSESLASSPSLPSYMVPTESARAKSRLSSPATPDRGGAGPAAPESAKKRLSFPVSPKPRRHSGPPKVDVASSTMSAVA